MILTLAAMTFSLAATHVVQLRGLGMETGLAHEVEISSLVSDAGAGVDTDVEGQGAVEDTALGVNGTTAVLPSLLASSSGAVAERDRRGVVSFSVALENETPGGDAEVGAA
jgi:hypothetical protein